MKQKNRLVIIAAPLIALLFVLVFYQYGYEKISSEMASVRQMEVEKTKTLAKYMAVVSQRKPLEAQLAALKERRKADDAKFIGTEAANLSAVALSDMVKGQITAVGGTVSSVRVDKSGDLGKFKVVNVAIDAVLPDPRGLVNALYGVETRVPYVIVKDMDIRVTDFKNPRQIMVILKVAALSGGK